MRRRTRCWCREDFKENSVAWRMANLSVAEPAAQRAAANAT